MSSVTTFCKMATFSRVALSARTTTTSAVFQKQGVRAFSSECAPAQKLRCVFEDYRQQNYSQELPSRFRKEVIKAMMANGGTTSANNSNEVIVDNFNLILANIGRSDAYLSEAELNDLLLAAGAAATTSRKISVQQAMQLM